MNDRNDAADPANPERGRDEAPDEHEGRVSEALEEATGRRQESGEGSSNRFSGSSAEPYEDEVQAEREGKTAQEVEEEDNEPRGEANRWFTG